MTWPKISKPKERFTRYDFLACEKLTTGLRHNLGPFTRAHVCREDLAGRFTRRDSYCSHGVYLSHAKKS